MAVNPVTYVKNVGKSFGYVALDVLGSTSPVMKDMIDSNKDTISSLYSEIKNFSSSPMEKIRNNQKIMSYSNDIKSGFQNLASDLKTGTFYNAARQNDAMNAAMGIDFDFDSMFDDIDLDFDEKSLNSDTKAAAAIADGSTKEILAMDVVGSRVATAVGTATAKSAEYIVNANAESTRAVLNQNSKIFSAISTGMIGINKTLGDIVKLSQPLTEHMQNSVTFYTKSTENQLKMIELLERIDNNTKMPEPKKGSGSKRYSGIEDYLGAGFGLDLGKLSGKVKGNFKNAFESTTFGMLLSMNDMFGEGTMTKMFASNPLGMIMPMVIEGAVMTPKLKKSLSQLSDALGAASLKMMRDLKKQKNSSNPIMSFIAELFGYDSGVGQRKYTGEYEKGPVPFDGVTRQAIIKVIPEYLSMILKAVSGGDQTYYDYKNGKFTTASQIRAKKEADEMYIVDKLGVDTKLGARSYAESRKAKEETLKDLERAVDEYVKNAIAKGDNYYIYADSNVAMMRDRCKEYGFSTKHRFDLFVKYVVQARGKDNQFGLEYLNARINSERVSRGNNPYDEFDVESYLEDSSLFTASRGGVSRSRESRTKGSKKGSGKGGSSDEGGPSEQLNASIVRQRLKAAGYDTNSSTYKNLTKEFDSYDKMTDNEKEKYIEKLGRYTSKSSASTANKSIPDVLNSVQRFFEAPLASVASMIDKGSTAIYNLLYGKEGEEGEKSILGHIFKNMKDMFTQFKDWTKKEIFDPIREYISERGGIKRMFMEFFGIDEGFDEWKRKFKERASQVTKDVGAKFRSAGRWMWDNSPVVQAGRRYKARRAQSRAASEWEESMYFNQMPEGSGSGLRGGSSEAPGFGRQVYDETIGGVKRFISAIFPDKKDLDKDFGKIGEVSKKALNELKLDPSGAITGALIGTGVSILTGGIVGPFLAAAIGGAAGLTINSETVQKALFGEDVVDEEGNTTHKAGLLGDKLTKFLTQDIKKMGAYGATSAVLAMVPGIPGGPLTGLMIGSALGFANREGKVTEALFGKDGEDGLISKDFQNKVKHLLPKAAAGAVLGLVAGPFGLVPNLIVGAGLGFASETETFQRYLFGEKDENGERHGGITGWIRKDIINPVARAIKPIAVEIKNKATDIIRWTIRSIGNAFGRTVGSPMFKVLNEKLLKPLINAMPGVGKFFGNIVSLPFRGIGGIGDALRRKQIRTGRANDMSAAERIEYRNQHFLGADEFTDFDTIISNSQDSDISEAVAAIESARKSKDQTQIDAAINAFRTKFGLQNVNVNNKNVDKWMDTAKAEIRNRKGGAATNLDPEKVRNQLIENHSMKIENMLGAIANKILGREVFETHLPGDIINNPESENGPGEGGVRTTRRNFATTVKSIFNPFTGMDMESVQDALGFYEDKLAGNSTNRYKGRKRDLNKMVQKVEVNGVLRDDIVNVTDKNGYTVTVRKVNGSWMPYKIGEQLAESLGMGGLARGIKTVAHGIGTAARMIYSVVTGDPFVGLNREVVNKALSYYLRFKSYAEPGLSDVETAYMNKYISMMEVQYPGENVIQITDDKGKSAMARFDEKTMSWKRLTAVWKTQYAAKRFAKRVGGAIVAGAKKIKSFAMGIIDAIRHVNPFCDFEPGEVGPIIDSLNDMEFNGGSDTTGKIKSLKVSMGLNHYYQVTSTNGTVVTVTPKGGKWVYVSNKALHAAQARTLSFGLGNMVANVAKGIVNKIGNRFNAGVGAESSPLDFATAGAGSRYRGSGFLGKAFNAAKNWAVNKITGSSGGDEGSFLENNTSSNADYKYKDNAEDVERSLTRINAEKFNANSFLKPSGITKEARAAFRERQSTLNIFRESNFTSNQISRKLDIIIASLCGEGAALGRGGTLGNIAKSLALLAAGVGGAYGLMSGKFDKALEGWAHSVDEDNATPGSGKASSWSYENKTTGETGELASENGQLIRGTDEQGDYYLDTLGNKIYIDDVDVYNNGAQGLGKKMPGLIAKGIITGNKSYLTPFRKMALTGATFGSRFGLAANQGIDRLLYTSGRRTLLNTLDKIPAINKLSSKVANTKFGAELLYNEARIEAKQATKFTEQRFKKIFGKDAAKRFTELEQMGVEEFSKKYPKRADYLLKYYTTETADQAVERVTKESVDQVIEKTAKEALDNAATNVTQEATEAATKAAKIATKDVDEIIEYTAKGSTKFTAAIDSVTSSAVVSKAAKESLEKKSFRQTIIDAFRGFFKNLKSNKHAIETLGSESVETFGEKLGAEVAEEAVERAEKKGTFSLMKNVTTTTPVVGWIVATGFAIYEFEEGWNSAARTFKVTDPTILEKFVSGLAPAMLEVLAIAIKGIDLIPIDWLISKAIDVLEYFGVSLGNLSKRRDEAEKQLEEVNAERTSKGQEAWTFDQWAVANKNLGGLGQRTWTEATVGAIKTDLNNFGEADAKARKEKTGFYSLTEEDFLVGFGSGLRGGSFVSQIDPSVSTRRFGGSTIGANGCAPSVASMITGMPLDQTASYAMRRGYTNYGGTSADYFGNVLGAAGIPAEYVYTGAGSAQDYLASRIAGGSPTVLLGQDPYNTSKAYSPFGPGNHYVLATGMTNDGGVIVQDPESSTPNNVYDSSILNNVKLGIPTGGNSGLLRRLIRRLRGGASAPYSQYYIDYMNLTGSENSLATQSTYQLYSASKKSTGTRDMSWEAEQRARYGYGGTRDMSAEAQRKAIEAAQGKTVTNQFDATGKANAVAQSAHGYAGELSTDHQEIWTYLKRKGISEEGAAALMGCWQAESGNHPNRIEGDYMSSFPGFDAVASSQTTMDNYVENILWPATEKNVSINRAAYKGNDGHLYPGFGLAQWTGKRAEKLLNYAKSKGLDWKSLGCQLDFAMSELSSTYSSVLSAIQNTGDIAELTKIVFNKYEGCKKEDWLRKRQEYAAMIYQEFTGKTFAMPSYTAGSDGSSSTNVTDKSGSGKKTSILDFGSMFGKLIAARFGKLGELFGLSTGDDETSIGEENQQEYDTSRSDYASGIAGSVGTVSANASSANNFPYYNQGSDPWGPMMYSATGNKNQTIKTSGCGPTSMAMVLKSYGKSYDPSNAATYSLNNGFRTENSGTAWGYFKSLGNKEGLDVEQFSSTAEAQEKLANNIPVIASMGPGYFTQKGHYIVLSGIDSNGNLLVNDPSSTDRTGKAWNMASSLGQAKQFWAISENGVGSIGRYTQDAIGGTRDMSWEAEQAARAGVAANTSINSAINYNTDTRFINQNGGTRDMSWAAEQAARSGSGSGLVYNIAQDGINTVNRRHRASRSAFGGSSALVNLSKYSSSRKSKYYNDLRKLRGSGMIDDAADKELMISLIKAIISLLSNVSANSDKIGQIANALGSLAAKSGNNGLAGSGLDTLSNNLGIQDTDTTIREMQQLLNNLASGQ